MQASLFRITVWELYIGGCTFSMIRCEKMLECSTASKLSVSGSVFLGIISKNSALFAYSLGS